MQNEFVTVFSTLSVDQLYSAYKVVLEGTDRDASKMEAVASFIIKGGANISNLHGTHVIHTPKGVANRVPRDVYENVLKKSDIFIAHIDNGFISVDETGSIDVDKAVKDMSEKDRSAQKNEKDIKNISLKSTDDVLVEVGKTK